MSGARRRRGYRNHRHHHHRQPIAMNTATSTDVDQVVSAPAFHASDASAPRYDAQRCLHELFEEQVRRRPDAVAARHKGGVVRYADLNARANRLARQLRTMGARPDVCVALCVDRSIDMLVGLLAILKSGAAYVPLDPDYPAARLRAMLDDCEPVALLTGRAQRGTFADGDSDFAIPRLDLSDGNGHWCALPDADLAPAAAPRDLAYVIYT
jgi:non-ribosomal peptide synthetase component F